MYRTTNAKSQWDWMKVLPKGWQRSSRDQLDLAAEHYKDGESIVTKPRKTPILGGGDGRLIRSLRSKAALGKGF